MLRALLLTSGLRFDRTGGRKCARRANQTPGFFMPEARRPLRPKSRSKVVGTPAYAPKFPAQFSVSRSAGMRLTFDPKYWRDRALEARATAQRLEDLETREKLGDIARTYDELAERAVRVLIVQGKKSK